MSPVSAAVRHALDGHDLSEVTVQVKELVCDELARVDRSAVIHRTEYFNHTFVPDVVLEWSGSERRDVYLRFINDAQRLTEDVHRLARDEGPIFFDLMRAVDGGEEPSISNQSVEQSLEEAPRLMVTDTDAVEAIRPEAVENLVERVVIRNVLRAGRGTWSEDVVHTASDATRSAFTGAITADAELVRRGAESVRDKFAPDVERRLERSLQLLWWAGGGAEEDFPLSVPDDMVLDPDDTREFLKTLLFDEQVIEASEFWSRLADRLGFDTLVGVGYVPPSSNLHRLMAQLGSRLKLSHAAIDLHPEQLPLWDPYKWLLDDGFLRLEGPSWSCRLTPHGNRFSQRRDMGPPLPLNTVRRRSKALAIEETEIDEESRRVQISRKAQEGPAQTPPSIADLAQGFDPNASVRRVALRSYAYQLSAEYDRMMVSAEPDAPVRLIALIAAQLLAGVVDDELQALSRFLDS